MNKIRLMVVALMGIGLVLVGIGIYLVFSTYSNNAANAVPVNTPSTRANSYSTPVSVKGGQAVNVAMIRDRAHFVVREKAEIGLFVTLTKPTEPMKVEAVKEGYYESLLGVSYPKIQILTIEGLLAGTEQAKYPDLMKGGLTFKKATIDSQTTQDKLF